MIFGLGRGKINVGLEKYNFYPGETIKGNISLQLKKHIRGSSLKVAFIGMKIVTERYRPSSSELSHHRRRTSNVLLHSFELILAQEKEYFREKYPFAIKIPDNILEEKIPAVKGALGKVIKIVRSLSNIGTRIEWYVEVKLDIPNALDIRKRVSITLG